MADRQTQIPGGPYLNDVEEATLYQRQIPGGPYVNETQQSAGVTFSAAWASQSNIIIQPGVGHA